ncbi:MAG: hypothetical protein AAFP97_09375 [Pseudomonadota bacterium]
MSATDQFAEITPKQAAKKYVSRVFGASLGYIGAVFGVSFLIDDGDPVTVFTIMAALLPGIFIVLMVLALWKYLSEMDEVARHDHSRALLIAAFTVLGLAGSWGLVELYNDAFPRIPVFFVYPAFFGVYGIVACMLYGRKA